MFCSRLLYVQIGVTEPMECRVWSRDHVQFAMYFGVYSPESLVTYLGGCLTSVCAVNVHMVTYTFLDILFKNQNRQRKGWMALWCLMRGSPEMGQRLLCLL